MKKTTISRRAEEDNEENVMQKAISKYLPYWPLFILLALISLSAAYVYLRYATPIYEASASILIKDEKRGTVGSKVEEQLNQISTQKTVENEVEVLQSRVLMENVVKRLNLYAPITQEGSIKPADAYVLSPIAILAKNPDSLIEAEKVYFTYDKNNKTITLNEKYKYPLDSFVNTDYGVLKFIPNEYYVPANESGKKLYFSLGDYKVFANMLVLGLKVSSNLKSAIVEINYRDPVPERAVKILNELVNVYQETSINEKNNLGKTTLAFLNDQLSVLRKDLDSIERKIQKYKSNTNAINVSAQGEMLIQSATNNAQKMGDLNNRLAMLGQVEMAVKSKGNNGDIAPSAVEDPALQALMGRLYNSQMEYNKMKQSMGESNPLLLAKEEEINKIRPGILESIQTQKASLAAARSSIASTNSGYTSKMREVPQQERAILEISREHLTKSQSYAFLLQKQQETELGIASATINSKIVDQALVGKEPVSPKKKIIYMMALVGALGLCVGIIIIKDAFTGKIMYRTEIEKMTSIPIIGEIAFDKSKTALVIEKGTRSFVAEEFRKLRISLSFLGVDSSHKKLLVTSSISGEGKSFIAANLAVSISLTGKKVVLVDMDLNNPSISKILNVNQEHGVTELLTGEKRVEDVIEKVEGQENLYFISGGNLPENPTELLANGKVNAIIDYLDHNFDMVVIDTSPAILVTDALILSSFCDATLYVIRHDYTPKMLVKRIDENNQINPIYNPAIVFNGVKTRGVFKNNYGYGYDYVYGNKERGAKTRKIS
jgi:capsular exopolysaccharide synthesis family protein